VEASALELQMVTAQSNIQRDKLEAVRKSQIERRQKIENMRRTI
jgi:hypothetical protein